MLVDDDPDFLDMYKYILEEKGYQVFCFSNPDDALKSIKEVNPKIVITDLMMTKLSSGFLLSREIKKEPSFKEVPIIIVTAIRSQYGFDFNPRKTEDMI